MKQRRLKLEERERGGGKTCLQASRGLQCQPAVFLAWGSQVTGLRPSLHIFSTEILLEQSFKTGLLHQEHQWVWKTKGGVRGGGDEMREWRKREKMKGGCDIRFILEGRIQLLVHRNAASVAMVTIGNNMVLLFSSPYPLNCIYLHFFCLHLWLMAGAGWNTSAWCLGG